MLEQMHEKINHKKKLQFQFKIQLDTDFLFALLPRLSLLLVREGKFICWSEIKKSQIDSIVRWENARSKRFDRPKLSGSCYENRFYQFNLFCVQKWKHTTNE